MTHIGAEGIITNNDCGNMDFSGSIEEIITLVFLGIMNCIVIAGNILVILAVTFNPKLRTVTNFFIVSLAVADLLVGLAVLPYSISLEVLRVWIFGPVWCQIWLAVDVWMCTSSILNLCAISLDRYVAITRPVHYRSIMTKIRAKILIATVWVFSFVICFPPLVGWNDSSMGIDILNDSKDIPRNIPKDIKLTNTSSLTYFHVENYSIPIIKEDCKISCALINNKGYVVYSSLGSFYIPMLIMLFFYFRIYQAALKTSRALNCGFKITKNSNKKEMKNENHGVTLRIHRGKQFPDLSCTNGRRAGVLVIPASPSPSRRNSSDKKLDESDTTSLRSNTGNSTKSVTVSDDKEGKEDGEKSSSKHGRSFFSRMSKRNARLHAKRFWSETKATKTVGIIVGCFICCWLPFFTVYLIRPFCEDCFPQLLFTIFFWLGYCNSAINPFIYAHFSKDFRCAFKNILFKCQFKDEGITSLIRQIHVPFFEEDYDDKNDSH